MRLLTRRVKNRMMLQVFARLGAYRIALKASPWRSLPELTQADGAHCSHSCEAQAWTVGGLLEVRSVTTVEMGRKIVRFNRCARCWRASGRRRFVSPQNCRGVLCITFFFTDTLPCSNTSTLPLLIAFTFYLYLLQH